MSKEKLERQIFQLEKQLPKLTDPRKFYALKNKILKLRLQQSKLQHQEWLAR